MAIYLNPDSVWKPFGVFSMAVIQGAGQIVHLKGQVSLDRAGNVVGAGDMSTQVHKVLENIRDVLGSVGGAMEDIISLTQYVVDIEAFMKCSDVRRVFFASPYPTTTTIEVRRLYDPRLHVEITATAEIPKDRFQANLMAQTEA
jgi:enamine deaminase RidA (YjgF/YER057c/UK114 family)